MRIKTTRAIVDEIRMIDGSSAVNQGMLTTLFETKQLKYYYRGNRVVADFDHVIEGMNKIYNLNEKDVMPRIRSIHNAFRELRELGIDTGISEERIRFLVEKKKLPSIEVGNRSYIALESFEAPYNECLIYDDFVDSRAAMIERMADEVFAASMASRK